jgi:hypothetical protein
LVYLKQKAHLPGEELVLVAIVATVLLSVLAHGISALPASRWYVRQVEGMGPDAPELATVADAVMVAGAL